MVEVAERSQKLLGPGLPFSTYCRLGSLSKSVKETTTKNNNTDIIQHQPSPILNLREVVAKECCNVTITCLVMSADKWQISHKARDLNILFIISGLINS